MLNFDNLEPEQTWEIIDKNMNLTTVALSDRGSIRNFMLVSFLACPSEEERVHCQDPQLSRTIVLEVEEKSRMKLWQYRNYQSIKLKAVAETRAFRIELKNLIQGYRFSLKKKSTSRPRSVRTPENVAAVREAVKRSPRRSAVKHAAALRLSDRSVGRILHADLKFHPYKMVIVQELSSHSFVTWGPSTSRATAELPGVNKAHFISQQEWGFSILSQLYKRVDLRESLRRGPTTIDDVNVIVKPTANRNLRPIVSTYFNGINEANACKNLVIKSREDQAIRCGVTSSHMLMPLSCPAMSFSEALEVKARAIPVQTAPTQTATAAAYTGAVVPAPPIRSRIVWSHLVDIAPTPAATPQKPPL
nr:unnamed protein product [Callosobruchus chinensis]